MTTRTPTVIDDLTALWNHESRSFLRYLVEESSPVSIDAGDEDFLMAIGELHDREVEVSEQMLELWEELGISPDQPCYELGFSGYNYMTPTALGRRYRDLAGREIAELEQIAERYREGSGVEGRLCEIVTALIAVRSSGRAVLDELLEAGGRARTQTEKDETGGGAER